MTWDEVVANISTKTPKKKKLSSRLSSRTYVARGYWRKQENRRKHLCEFATKMGFDPLVAKNWEKLPPSVLKSGAQHMSGVFKSSYKLTIMDAFPEAQFSLSWRQHIKYLP